jgi:hypothetical protein
VFTRLEHDDGVENHDQLGYGEQCECGVLGLGIVRATGEREVNNFRFYMHEFDLSMRTPVDDEPVPVQAPRGGIRFLKPPAI